MEEEEEEEEERSPQDMRRLNEDGGAKVSVPVL
jgi:hypothetical protein